MDDLRIIDEKLQLDIELQQILDMACNEDGVEEISECIPPLNTFEGKSKIYIYIYIYIDIGCDRGADYRASKTSLDQRKRNSGSHLINCQFEKILQIKEMSKAGIPPRQILSSLQQSNPHLQVVSRNIYNQIAEILTKGYPYVFVMDCTCKTNKSKMPLLDIIGVSSFNTSFNYCFVFMKNEKEEDYMFDNHPMVNISDKELALMNDVHIVFPSTSNLLCTWHIEKNILANSWSSFEVKYKEKKFVLAYILITHFSNRATSRAQDAHATLKKYLQVST
ncbi:unnamed protein product [Malus baccata var. baccata]